MDAKIKTILTRLSPLQVYLFPLINESKIHVLLIAKKYRFHISVISFWSKYQKLYLAYNPGKIKFHFHSVSQKIRYVKARSYQFCSNLSVMTACDGGEQKKMWASRNWKSSYRFSDELKGLKICILHSVTVTFIRAVNSEIRIRKLAVVQGDFIKENLKPQFNQLTPL